MAAGPGRLRPFCWPLLSMSGLPPFLGFIGKELMMRPRWSCRSTLNYSTGVLLLTNILMVTAALILLIRPFFGPLKEAHPHHKTPFNLWLGPVTLGGLALLLGLFASSEAFSESLVATAVSAIAGSELHVHLALWHGLTPMLALSGVTLLGGVAVCAAHARLQPGAVRLDTAVRRVGPANWYSWLLDGTLRFAGWFTEKFQNGKLRYYLLYVLATTLLLVGGTLVFRAGIAWEGLELTPLRLPEVLLALVLLAAVGVAVRVESRLTAVAALGVVGYSIAVFYILFSAPDLAMTQFAIETLTVILFVLVLYRLPRFEQFSSRRTRLRDGVVAVFVGLLMAGLTLMAQSVHVRGASALADFFIHSTESLAGGHNVVNVILVDFRGFDTMVEITVLSVAAIGVYALLKSRTIYLERLRAAQQTAVPDPARR
ncbi:MAG: hydrogen gas-evolving membrane-bound hydrogenase subunit E [Chloroflexota bacterium]